MTKAKDSSISPALIDEICERLARDQPVRRTLMEGARIHIDRQLPFLCVYRRPPTRPDPGTEGLVKGEASYLIAPGAPADHRQVSALVRGIAVSMSAEFGSFLLLEVWAAPEGGKANDPAVPSVEPTFAIHAPDARAIDPSVEVLRKGLSKIRVLKHGVQVEVNIGAKVHPPGLRPLLGAAELRALSCFAIGVAIPPVYRRESEADESGDSPAAQPLDGREFPLLSRTLRRNLGLAFRRTFFEFARTQTTHRAKHHHALGRRAVVKAVWEIDRKLAEVGSQFDYLLMVTPVNTASAWKTFQHRKFAKAPEFHYRPLPVDPELLKRQLFKIPCERVEDPALQRLFLEKQQELELKINMLRDRETPSFLYQSLQLFGRVEEDLMALARDLLERFARGSSKRTNQPDVEAEDFARRAEAELASYREAYPAFDAQAQITSEVSSLMVSRGQLLIPEGLSVAPARVEPLLAHEVGTHLLTYYNGHAQRFQQLYSGLAGYEELQEGLAVLSEFLVGGLSRQRLRLLAGRVVAVHHLLAGSSFVETFRELDQVYGFTRASAFSTTMRVYRGGGLTKDVVYLRGLRELLDYLREGGELEPLLVGKIAVKHIPLVRELQLRKVLAPAPLLPHHLKRDDCVERLRSIPENQMTIGDLVT